MAECNTHAHGLLIALGQTRRQTLDHVSCGAALSLRKCARHDDRVENNGKSRAATRRLRPFIAVGTGDEPQCAQA